MGLTKTTRSASRRASRLGAAVGENGVSPLQQQVLAAAAHACDHFGDSPAAREQMRRDVLATPAALLPDLLRAFAAYQPRPPPREPPTYHTSCGCLLHRGHQDQPDEFQQERER